MSIVRFGVSLENELLKQFDMLCQKHTYTNRSEAIRDLIREVLVKKEWSEAKGDVTGVVTLVYDHHKRELVDHLIDIQHNHIHKNVIISSQHIHLNHDNCLEVIVVKGKARDISGLAAQLRSAKGVKHGELVMTTTGKHLC